MPTILSLLLRVVLVAAGLVVAASFAVAAVVLACVWLLRSGWARLTGRQVTPFVMRVHPRQGFERARARRPVADVTDVEPKTPSL